MQAQDYRHHTRIDPLFHRVGMPLALLNLLGSIALLAAHFSWAALLALVSALALGITLAKTRGYATSLQDRIIRGEENFRHYVLTGKPLDPRLSRAQIIALRFAADDEFPALCRRAVEENMGLDAIKAAVRSWRADVYRV